MVFPRAWQLAVTAIVTISAVTDAFPLGFLFSTPTEEERALVIGPVLPPTSFQSLATNDDHSYFRPSGDEVSGIPKNSAPYHRSPCPCMNSLANHGYIPRDGKNLTPALLKQVVMERFNLDSAVTDAIVSNLPPTLTLADLGVHNFIEHDASLVHDEAYFGGDPSHVNATLVAQFLARANPQGRLSVREVGRWRYDREVECKRSDPKYDFGVKRQAGAYAEAAAFLIAMGQWESQSISVEHARSFLLNERIPDDFERSKVQITIARALYVAAKIKALSSFPYELVSTSRRWLQSVVSQEWSSVFPLNAVA